LNFFAAYPANGFDSGDSVQGFDDRLLHGRLCLARTTDFDMKAILKTIVFAASAARPGAAAARQHSSVAGCNHSTGPDMGQQQIERSHGEHEKADQGMGRQMEQRSHQQGGEHAPMGPR
jgi:hypothetical protein